jgi:hypothetical protein
MKKHLLLAPVLSALAFLTAGRAWADPISGVIEDPNDSRQQIFSLYESDGNGKPGEISSPVASLHAPDLVSGFVVLLESGTSQDPSNWSDVVKIFSSTGGQFGDTVQLFSDPLNDRVVQDVVQSGNAQFLAESATDPTIFTRDTDPNASGGVSFTDTFKVFSNSSGPDPNPEGGGDPAPEPAALTLLGLGIAGLAAYRWRVRKRVLR